MARMSINIGANVRCAGRTCWSLQLSNTRRWFVLWRLPARRSRADSRAPTDSEMYHAIRATTRDGSRALDLVSRIVYTTSITRTCQLIYRRSVGSSLDLQGCILGT